MKRTMKFFMQATFLLGLMYLAPLTADYQGNIDIGPPVAMAVNSAAPAGPDGLTLQQFGTPQGMEGAAVTSVTNPSQVTAAFALGQSAVVLYSTAQTPSAVAANSTPEQAFTVTGVLAGSVVHVIRASAPTGGQAGLGIVGARVSAASTVQVNYCNVTANSITPTAENYLVIEIRGPLVQTLALTFANTVTPLSTQSVTLASTKAVSSVSGTPVQNLSSAQQASTGAQSVVGNPNAVPPNFTIANPNNTTASSVVDNAGNPTASAILSGNPQTVIVNKASGQAGLGYWGWIAGNYSLGLTFSNTSGAGIAPTNETYTLFACRGVSLHGPVHYLVNWGSPAGVTSEATTPAAEQTFTCNGLAVGDTILSINRASAQTGLKIGGWRVTTANTLGIVFVNPTTSSITPTASEVIDVVVDKARVGLGGNQSGAVLWQFTAPNVALGALTTITGAAITTAVTGILSGAPVVPNIYSGTTFAAGLGGGLPAGIIFGGARMSAAGTLELNILNVTAANITAANSGTVMVTGLQGPTGISGATAGAAGSAVVYDMDNQLMQNQENDAATSLATQLRGIYIGS